MGLRQRPWTPTSPVRVRHSPSLSPPSSCHLSTVDLLAKAEKMPKKIHPPKNTFPKSTWKVLRLSFFLSPALPTHRARSLAVARSLRQAQTHTHKALGYPRSSAGFCLTGDWARRHSPQGGDPKHERKRPVSSKSPTWLPVRPTESGGGAAELPAPWCAKECQEWCCCYHTEVQLG